MDDGKKPAEFVDLTITTVAGVDAGANETQMGGARGWLVLKSATTPDQEASTMTTTAAADKKTDDAENGDDDEDMEKDDVEKALASGSVPEAVAKALADMRAEVAKSRAEADEAKKAADAERDARIGREFVEKARGFAGLPTTAEKFGPVLRSVEELLPAEHAAEVIRLLKAAGEAGAWEALTKEFGTDTRGSADGFVSIEKAAAEIRKADPSITVAKSLELAMDQNPALVAAHQKGA